MTDRRPDSERDWQIVPCPNPPGWHTVGYVYLGDIRERHGEFVPIHHWRERAAAELFVSILEKGFTRDEARDYVEGSRRAES